MKAAICEDEKIYSDLLSAKLNEYFAAVGESVSVSVFTDGDPLLSACENGAVYDIAFLDIQLESSDGMETAAKLRAADSELPIVFVTGLKDRAVEGYAVEAFDYIVKSTIDERLFKVLDRFMKERGKASLAVTDADGGTVFLRFSDILYIESSGRGTAIHTKDGAVTSPLPVGKLSAELPADKFVEIYKSIYVRVDAIGRIDSDTITIISGAVLPLSRRKRKAVMSAVMKAVKGSIA